MAAPVAADDEGTTRRPLATVAAHVARLRRPLTLTTTTLLTVAVAVAIAAAAPADRIPPFGHEAGGPSWLGQTSQPAAPQSHPADTGGTADTADPANLSRHPLPTVQDIEAALSPIPDVVIETVGAGRLDTVRVDLIERHDGQIVAGITVWPTQGGVRRATITVEPTGSGWQTISARPRY